MPDADTSSRQRALMETLNDKLADQLESRITSLSAIDEAIYGDTVLRVTLDRPQRDGASTAIVKRRRPDGAWRSEPERLHAEIAALRFLDGITPPVTPRLLAVGANHDVIAMEDFGALGTLEAVLFANDPAAATEAMLAFARALGRLHAITAGREGEWIAMRSTLGPIDRERERNGLFETSIRDHWPRLRAIATETPGLPSPGPDVDAEAEQIAGMILAPGPWAVLSNNDPCPANTHLRDGELRFLDFEHATFHHAMLDVTALRLPFPACPCWSLLPAEVMLASIAAYRQEAAAGLPMVRDDDAFGTHLAAGCGVWAIQRLTRFPKRDAIDEPHPVGFSRRGQMIDTAEAAASAMREAGAFPALADWLEAFATALEDRWTPVSAPLTRPRFPAFA